MDRIRKGAKPEPKLPLKQNTHFYGIFIETRKTQIEQLTTESREGWENNRN